MTDRKLVTTATAFLAICFVFCGSGGAWGNGWSDYGVASYVGGSMKGVEIEKRPGASVFGILDSWVSTGNYPLRYSEGYGASWTSSAVTSSTNGEGRWGLAYHPTTLYPYVSYQDGGAQYLSHYDGDAWQAEVVVGSGAQRGSSLAFSPITGEPLLAFDLSGTGLVHAWHDASGWHTETIDSSGGYDPSLRIDPGTAEVCVAYSCLGARFARRSPSAGWSTTTVGGGSFTSNTVMEFDPVAGQPGVAYCTALPSSVGYSEFDGTSWHASQVNAAGHYAGRQVGLAYLDSGMPIVIYGPGSSSKPPASQYSFVATYKDASGWHVWDEHSYGAYNWNGPVDVLADGSWLHVGYEATNIGVHYATKYFPEPGTVSLFAMGLGLMILRRRRRR